MYLSITDFTDFFINFVWEVARFLHYSNEDVADLALANATMYRYTPHHKARLWKVRTSSLIRKYIMGHKIQTRSVPICDESTYLSFFHPDYKSKKLLKVRMKSWKYH